MAADEELLSIDERSARAAARWPFEIDWENFDDRIPDFRPWWCGPVGRVVHLPDADPAGTPIPRHPSLTRWCSAVINGMVDVRSWLDQLGSRRTVESVAVSLVPEGRGTVRVSGVGRGYLHYELEVPPEVHAECDVVRVGSWLVRSCLDAFVEMSRQLKVRPPVLLVAPTDPALIVYRDDFEDRSGRLWLAELAGVNGFGGTEILLNPKYGNDPVVESLIADLAGSRVLAGYQACAVPTPRPTRDPDPGCRQWDFSGLDYPMNLDDLLGRDELRLLAVSSAIESHVLVRRCTELLSGSGLEVTLVGRDRRVVWAAIGPGPKTSRTGARRQK